MLPSLPLLSHLYQVTCKSLRLLFQEEKPLLAQANTITSVRQRWVYVRIKMHVRILFIIAFTGLLQEDSQSPHTYMKSIRKGPLRFILKSDYRFKIKD